MLYSRGFAGAVLMVKDFLDKATAVVMLHGVEYLTTINGFGPISV